jgi:hypothetical protein
MTNWQRLLREGDPAADAVMPEPAANAAMSEDDAQSIRRVVVAAVQESTTASRWWSQPLALAAMVVLMFVSGAIAGHRLTPRPLAPVPAQAPPAPEEPRQLQFATPGGTRIIWTFNPEFDRKESIP